MDIYQAREIQKILYKHSECSRKKMRTIIDKNGRLCYTVSHYFEDNHIPLYLYKKRIESMIKIGIDFDVWYIDNIPEIPKGLYLGEIIPID